MMTHLYSTARTSSDYQDAALINLLWYLFGRASDLCIMPKQKITIDAGGVFFMKFIRMKTNEEQGLSLFPDNEFQTCPLLAMGLSLMSHVALSPDLVDNLPQQAKMSPVTLGLDAPLNDLLDNRAIDSKAAPSSTNHLHVNRLFDRIIKLAGVGKISKSRAALWGALQIEK
ncbi:hypothetical protein AaE_012467 [Aphanomyces astaci]|uniref:Uncharacterized protein n=1 Tax=Aphanomyces astaci TaxID=112090 RepID=A0A6A4ZHY5_APHAT|nr:hypothetical protein AaE_012467 [Aphanomyces astaci]